MFSTACPPVRVWLITAFQTMEPCEPEAGRRRQPKLPRVSIRRVRNERDNRSSVTSGSNHEVRCWDERKCAILFTDSPLMSDRYIKSKLQYKWHHVSLIQTTSSVHEDCQELLCPYIALLFSWKCALLQRHISFKYTKGVKMPDPSLFWIAIPTCFSYWQSHKQAWKCGRLYLSVRRRFLNH